MMAGRARKEELEALATAFLASAAPTAAPDRLREYGLQRVFARARAAETGKEPAVVRHAYRNPALLRHAIMVAVVALLVMFVSTTGVYAFSLQAQPGSTLYGAKIFFERARVTLNTSSAGDVLLEMGFSERRMEELENMVATGNQRGADRWLHEYSRNVEGAGILFEGMALQDAEGLSAQFQEMLERQAHMMQGMRQGLQPGLSEPVEGAYKVCGMERERMRRRCGQQDPAGPDQGPDGQGGQQEPGGQGQQGQGNCPGMEGNTTPEGVPSSTLVDPVGGSTGSVESGQPADTSGEGPGGGTTDGNTDPPADTSQPQSPAGGGSGQLTVETGYQGEGPHKGCMP